MTEALVSRPVSSGLAGTIRPPSDKSISHRALILAGLAEGESELSQVLDSSDTRATRSAMEMLGASYQDQGVSTVVRGAGASGLQASANPLDLGNSGTGLRLLTGVLAAQPFDSVIGGDASLNSRPMGRITRPLIEMGARIESSRQGTAPLRIGGNRQLHGITYESPVASAQVKSCLLLAGLFATGATRVREPRASRDHTERMLPAFGVELNGPASVTGGQALHGAQLDIPADPSSSAFLLAAAALVPDSEVTCVDTGTNPTRSGFFGALRRMGASLSETDRRETGGEPLASVSCVFGGRLSGIDVDEQAVPAMIDELPLLMAIAATADGITRIRGAAELRVKESDRIAVMVRGLETLGVEMREYPDGVDVVGGTIGGGVVDAHNDHRCAMSFAVLGLIAAAPVSIHRWQMINTSYPRFVDDLQHLGASLSPGNVE